MLSERSITANNKVETKMKVKFNRHMILYFGIILITIIALVFFPPYFQRVLIEMMIYALLAMSLDLLVGYTGIVSFGHAAFFGLTMYTSGLLIMNSGWPFLLSVVVGVAFTVIVATLIGWLCVRLSGIQFAMLTLAFGMLIWTIITKWRDVTRGLDGFSVNEGLMIAGISLSDPKLLLIVTAVVLIVSFWSMNKLVQSNFGKALLAVKENEQRTKFIGFNIIRIKLQVFVISSFYAAMAGILFMLLKTFVSPEFLHWSFSGNILMMTILGGMGTLVGPLLGASVFVWFQDWASSYTENWMIVVGIVFVVIVLYLPKGVFGWIIKR